MIGAPWDCIAPQKFWGASTVPLGATTLTGSKVVVRRDLVVAVGDARLQQVQLDAVGGGAAGGAVGPGQAHPEVGVGEVVAHPAVGAPHRRAGRAAHGPGQPRWWCSASGYVLHGSTRCAPAFHETSRRTWQAVEVPLPVQIGVGEAHLDAQDLQARVVRAARRRPSAARTCSRPVGRRWWWRRRTALSLVYALLGLRPGAAGDRQRRRVPARIAAHERGGGAHDGVHEVAHAVVVLGAAHGHRQDVLRAADRRSR